MVLTDEARELGEKRREYKARIREMILLWLELFGTEWIGLQEYVDRLPNDLVEIKNNYTFGILERYGFLQSNKTTPDNPILDYQLKLSDRAFRFLEDDSVLKLVGKEVE